MAITHKELVDMLSMSRPIMSDEFALQTFEAFPQWNSMLSKQITQDMIDKGFDRYQYNGQLYKCVQAHTPQSDWTPDKTPALWVKVSLEEYPEWVQPAGAHDAYKKGDKVTHNGKKWESTVDTNVWEPGVHGWNEVTSK